MGYAPQYWYQDADAGTVVALVKNMVPAEHAPLSLLVLVVATSDGANSKTPQPVKASPPQLVVK